MTDASCPRCGAPRASTPDCPRCGVIYARAEARARRLAEDAAPQPAAVPLHFPAPDRPPHLPAETPTWDGEGEEQSWEQRLRLIAPPTAIALALLFVTTGPGRFLARVCSGMWLHEFGHALCAWLCGYVAVPLPWFTSIGRTKSPVLVLMFVALWSWLSWRSHKAGRGRWRSAFAAVAALHLLLAIALKPSQGQAAITFFGDGGALLLGAALMITFFVERDSRLHQGALRWGFLGLGALGFADVFVPWVRAIHDRDEVPFGHIEGVGLSDPSKLADVHGMTTRGMVNAYVALGVLALLAVAAAYLQWAVRPALQARRREHQG